MDNDSNSTAATTATDSAAIKTYRAGTGISITVTLPSGASRRVSFAQLSNGTSHFTTSDADMQRALERHALYGRLFRLAKVRTTAEVKAENEAKAEQSAAATEKKKKNKVVKVADLPSAKEYLADKCGVSRTALRSRKAILEHAESFGITFQGLD